MTMHVALDLFQAGDVFGFFGQERIEHGFFTARCMQAAFDAVLVDEILEPESWPK